jgi:hypothetical protein
MPDIRLIQPRTRVTIELYPQDVTALVTQQEMMCSFTKEQVNTIIDALKDELATRGEKHDRPDASQE